MRGRRRGTKSEREGDEREAQPVKGGLQSSFTVRGRGGINVERRKAA